MLHLVALISGLFCPFRWVSGKSVQHGCDTETGAFAVAYWQRWFRQNAFHFAAQPPRTIAHDRSPPMVDLHQAAVRLPLALPSERQRMVGPATYTWPSGLLPVGLPIKRTNASRDALGPVLGHGWCWRQLPSVSLVAIPARRTRGPSAHQIGPSPSQTRMGVQLKVLPLGTTATAARMIMERG